MPYLTEVISRAGGRPENQDHAAFLEAGGSACWVVADGLGGHRGGETASRTAVEAILASFERDPQIHKQMLERHLKAAQSAVLDAQTRQSELATMRTTIVVVLANATVALWAHMGDSRLYCFEEGLITAQTADHSVVQAMVDAKDITRDQMRHHEDRNRLLRCLGNPESEFRPTILARPRPVAADSAFLLCTDGFWENVLESEMAVDLAKANVPQAWLTLMEDRLLERANEGDDNYTAIAVMVAR
jgi:serine/threonine protein phosphatase PrpC